MERSKSESGYYSRRSVIAAFVGGAAALSLGRSVETAPGPETNYGGVLCVTAPSEEGVLELASIHESATDNELYINQSDIAERYENLTVVPSETVQQFINEQLRTARTSLEATELLSEFTLNHFGIPIYLDMKVTETESSRTVSYSPVPVESQALLLKNLSKLPIEFYKAVGVTHIIFEDLPGTIGGDYTHALNRVRLDTRWVGDSNVLYHEFSHALHKDGCGDFEDAAITDTLPDGVEYTDESRNEPLPGDVFVDPYGQKNYKEDFATIAAAWITGRVGLSDEIEGTPVYEKLAVVMDRFETLVPGIVPYIEEVVRPSFNRQA